MFFLKVSIFLAVGIMNKLLYVTGGIGLNGRCTSTCEYYNPMRGEWAPAAALPQQMSYAGKILSRKSKIQWRNNLKKTGGNYSFS